MTDTTSATFALDVLERHMREGAAALDALKAAMRSAPSATATEAADQRAAGEAWNTEYVNFTGWQKTLLAGFHTDFPQPDSTDTKKP